MTPALESGGAGHPWWVPRAADHCASSPTRCPGWHSHSCRPHTLGSEPTQCHSVMPGHGGVPLSRWLSRDLPCPSRLTSKLLLPKLQSHRPLWEKTGPRKPPAVQVSPLGSRDDWLVSVTRGQTDIRPRPDGCTKRRCTNTEPAQLRPSHNTPCTLASDRHCCQVPGPPAPRTGPACTSRELVAPEDSTCGFPVSTSLTVSQAEYERGPAAGVPSLRPALALLTKAHTSVQPEELGNSHPSGRALRLTRC